MNSIYIEAQTILSNKPAMEYLDGCGATWCGVDEIFSAHKPKDTNIVFNGMARNQFTTTSYPEDYTHTPTALEFCQGVARIMGIPEPTFGGDEPKTGPKKLGGSALPASPVYLHEGEPSGNPGELPTKGMAIEVSRLSEEDRKTLEDLTLDSQLTFKQALSSKYSPPYICMPKDSRILEYCGKDWYEQNGYTITTNPTEFMEYVAQQTGKEYKATISKMETVEHVNNSYKFKTYRILDSLDNWPLDKRTKLSEWIPPFGPKSKVFFTKEKVFAYLMSHQGEELICLDENEKHYGVSLDGEWMRIV